MLSLSGGGSGVDYVHNTRVLLSFLRESIFNQNSPTVWDIHNSAT